MGGVVIWIATRGSSMPTSGWQVSLSAHLQHYAHVVTQWAQTLPGWITGIAVVAALAALAWKGLREAAEPDSVDADSRALEISETSRPRLQEEPR